MNNYHITPEQVRTVLLALADNTSREQRFAAINTMIDVVTESGPEQLDPEPDGTQ